MPIRYEIANDMVITTGSGIVTFEEIRDIAVAQSRDRKFDSRMSGLILPERAEKAPLTKRGFLGTILKSILITGMPRLVGGEHHLY